MAGKIQKKRIINKKVLEVLMFLIKFNLLAIPLYLAIFFNFSVPQLQNFLASLISFFLKALRYDAINKDFTISILHLNKLNQIEISWDCTGWKSLYALFALTLATPANLIKKIKFLIFALPGLFLINLARILTTIIFCLSYGFNYFEIIHTFFWRWGLVFLVPLIWIAWIKTLYFKKSKFIYRAWLKKKTKLRANLKKPFSKLKKG
jgi:exosortase/archaeosortase family protein